MRVRRLGQFLVALTVAAGCTLAPEAISYAAPPSTSGFRCFASPIQGGTDEPDAYGMYPPAVRGSGLWSRRHALMGTTDRERQLLEERARIQDRLAQLDQERGELQDRLGLLDLELGI